VRFRRRRAPDARRPGYECFSREVICKPNWNYVLAGGLARPLDPAALPSEHHRLSVYAWDWAGNTTARDFALSTPLLRPLQLAEPSARGATVPDQSDARPPVARTRDRG
jgi:hypothetical protein